MPTLLPISDAADFLGVTPKTLRRWEENGRLSPHRTNGNQRRYAFEDLQPIKEELSSKNGDHDAHPEVKIALEKLESLDSKLDKIEDKLSDRTTEPSPANALPQLPVIPPPPPPAPIPVQIVNNPQPNRKTSRLPLIVGIILILLLAEAAAFAFFSQKSLERTF